jgi:hypothetical protein
MTGKEHLRTCRVFHDKTIIYGIMVSSLLFASQPVAAQEKITDRAAVIVLDNQIFAATPDEGLARLDLSAGEKVLVTETKGLNAFVQTSIRLLGFSSSLKTWSEQRTDLSEHIVERHITPRLILIRTNKRLYGFQALTGRWRHEEFGAREEVREVTVADHIAVAVTERRVLAFSAFTGGFFSQDLQLDEQVTETMANDNIAVLTTPVRRLIFRSQLKIWAELR